MASPERAAQAGQIDAIESLRGIAALLVLVYHLAELMKLPLP